MIEEAKLPQTSTHQSWEPRKRKPGAGRPSLGKVKMTVHILPATRKALGDKPGEVLDAHFGGSNVKDTAAEIVSDKLRNALKVLLGDMDHLGHWIPDPCRRLVEDALAKGGRPRKTHAD